MLEVRLELRSHRISVSLAVYTVRKAVESFNICEILLPAPWGILRAEQSLGKELPQPPGHL